MSAPGGMESLIALGEQIDQMTFEPLTHLIKIDVDELGGIDPNLEYNQLQQDAIEDPGLQGKALDAETGGAGYYTKIDGTWTKLGPAESVIRQGVASFIIEQLTNFGSKVPEVLKAVVGKFMQKM